RLPPPLRGRHPRRRRPAARGRRAPPPAGRDQVDAARRRPSPGGKSAKRPTGPEQIIRRTSNGRLQISHVREGCWSSESEADFLARLRATGNFDASARAVGFRHSSLYRRMDDWPAFARDCRAALDAAEALLAYRLVAHAHALL